MIRLRLACLLVLFLSFPTTWAASEPRDCESDLRKGFQRFKSSHVSDREYRLAVTQLLNRTLSPLLHHLIASVEAASDHDVREIYRTGSIRFPLWEGAGNELAKPGEASYKNQYYRDFGGAGISELLCNDSNRSVMLRMERATSWILFYVIDHSEELLELPSLRSGAALLKEHTYAGKAIEYAMRISNGAVLQSLAQITVDPDVPLANSEMILNPARVVLLVRQMALNFPPRLMAKNASIARYYDRALDLSSVGVPAFASSFNGHLRDEKRSFRELATPQNWEMGFGCPVAHKCPGADESSLESYVKMLVRLADRLAPVEP